MQISIYKKIRKVLIIINYNFANKKIMISFKKIHNNKIT